MARMKLLLTLLTLCWCAADAATTFHGRHSNSSLPLSDVLSTSTAVKSCECRDACYKSNSCRGYTVATLPSGEFSCSLGNTFLHETQLVPKLDQLPNWTTFIIGPCPEDFTEVNGVGCIFLSSDKKTQTDAKASCPPGSGLLSVFSDAAYRRAQKYITSVLVFTSAWNSVYTGMEKIDGKWTWRDGHTIPGDVGSSVWYKSDPNSNSATCTAMIYNRDDPINLNGQLVDVWCNGQLTYACSMP